MNIEKELFEIFLNSKDQYTLYNAVMIFVQKKVDFALGAENAKFYEHFRQLMNSINNAGWEERHSQQISYIHEVMGTICDKYEEYLP